MPNRIQNLVLGVRSVFGNGRQAHFVIPGPLLKRLEENHSVEEEGAGRECHPQDSYASFVVVLRYMRGTPLVQSPPITRRADWAM